MSYDDISFGFLEYLPPVVLVSLSFLKTFKVCWENVSFLTQGTNHDSVVLIMSGLCRLFSTSMSAPLFLTLWQFMSMERKFGLFFCL